MQVLQQKNESGVVTIPKQWLEMDGIVSEDGEFPEQQSLMVDRLGERVYAVRLLGGDVPALEDTEEIERLAATRAQEMLENTLQSPLAAARANSQ
jgi:hypothetical protein